MGIAVRDLLDAEGLSGIRLMSGEKGLDNEITGITIIEAPDIVRFIDGGEILLTALYAFKTSSVEKFGDYFRQIAEKQVSGIMLKLGRKVEDADAKVALLLEMAQEYGIPVLEVPFDMSFRNILVYVLGHLFNEEVMELKYFKTTHDNFTALMLAEDNGEDKLSRILEALEKMIGSPLALFDRRRNCLAASADAPRTLVIQENAEETGPLRYSSYPYLRQIYDGHVQYLLSFPVNNHQHITLVITEMDQPFGTMDCIAVESAVSAFRYEFARRLSVGEVERKFQNDILHKILNGRLHSQDELRQHTRLLGLPMEGNFRVIVFCLADAGAPSENPRDYAGRISQTELLREAVGACLRDVRLQNDPEYVALISQVKNDVSGKEYRESICRLLARVQREICSAGVKQTVQIGVGGTVNAIADVRSSYEEAKTACRFADVAAEIADTKDAGVTFFSDLGIFTLLVGEKDPRKLEAYIPEGLKKLLAYRRPQRDDLLITLKTYLDKNLNLSQTAQSLYIHYKTAAYRMEKIQNITEIDFDSPNEVLAYRIGFVVCKLIKKLEE